eukprot:TRINITY_DN17782_c0_g1_i1.p1 TRINITY_DN17782_c0_g1~~TRINITY_DN17782_c0_g1_i1.p1  ORF type:complete len:217 (+),score=52.80 TRINITY_DN17782_c0_g1_i1:47-697(+)
MFLFGKQKTPKEIMRENQRLLKRTVRDIDRERMSLQNQEKKIIIEIKKLAKADQMNAARIMAKDLVRTRNQVNKMYKLKTEIQAVSLRIQTLNSTATMADAMKNVTRAMVRMNRTMNLPAIQQVMMEFEKQSEIMDMKEEIMNDSIDGINEEDGEEEESEEIINQVLEEISMNMKTQLGSTPMNKVAVAETQQEPVPVLADADLELMARLDNLRKN